MSSPSDHHDNISEPLLHTSYYLTCTAVRHVHLAYLTCVRYGSLTSRRDCSQLHVLVSTPVQWAGISRRGRVVIVYMTSAWHLSSTQPSVGLHRLDSQRRVIEITASLNRNTWFIPSCRPTGPTIQVTRVDRVISKISSLFAAAVL